MLTRQENEADTLAHAGSEMIALRDLLLKGHLLKRHICIAIQAMFLACYIRRQERRQDMVLDTTLERELEGEPTQGGELAAPAQNLLEDMFAPLDRVMTALAAQ